MYVKIIEPCILKNNTWGLKQHNEVKTDQNQLKSSDANSYAMDLQKYLYTILINFIIGPTPVRLFWLDLFLLVN